MSIPDNKPLDIKVKEIPCRELLQHFPYKLSLQEQAIIKIKKTTLLIAIGKSDRHGYIFMESKIKRV